MMAAGQQRLAALAVSIRDGVLDFWAGRSGLAGVGDSEARIWKVRKAQDPRLDWLEEAVQTPV